VFSNIGNAGYFSELQDVENKYYTNGIIEELIELKWYLPLK